MIQPLHELAYSKTDDPIDFTTFSDRVGEAVNQYLGDDIEIYFQKIAPAIGLPKQSSRFARRISNWVRPKNVFPIPFFLHSLSGYTEIYRGSIPYTLESINVRMEPAYKVISKYLHEYECL